MLLNCPCLLASFVSYLHSKPHELIPKEYSVEHLPSCILPRDKILPPQESQRVLIPIKSIQRKDQKLDHNVHVGLVPDHYIKVFALKLES